MTNATDYTALAEAVRGRVDEQLDRWNFKAGQVVLCEIERKNREGENCYRGWHRGVYVGPSDCGKGHIVNVWHGIRQYPAFCRTGEVQPIPQLKRRTVWPLALLTYARGLLERYAETEECGASDRQIAYCTELAELADALEVGK